MGHRKSIVREVCDTYEKMAAYGTKKHIDKQNNDNKPAMEKIYSYGTMGNYIDAGVRFARWAREEHGCKTVAEAREWTGDYLRHRMDSGLSAWTVRRDAAALGKLYQVPTTELGATLPARERHNITQHRSETTWKGHFNEDRHRDLVETARACDLRRHELANLRPEDVHKDKDGTVTVYTKGKGGRPRTVTALNDAPWRAAEAARQAGQERVFEHIPNRAPIHAYRADFARDYYRAHARDLGELREHEIYRCRGDDCADDRYDRATMRETSEQLGHSRVDVVVVYLRDL